MVAHTVSTHLIHGTVHRGVLQKLDDKENLTGVSLGLGIPEGLPDVR
jgi:hypothetical protein